MSKKRAKEEIPHEYVWVTWEDFSYSRRDVAMCMVNSPLEVHRGYSNHSFSSQNNL